MTAGVCALVLLLPLAVVARWGLTGWWPVTSRHEPLELGPMYIGGIEVELLLEHGYDYREHDERTW